MRPSTHLYYSWTLGYALLYNREWNLVAMAEPIDGHEWHWRPVDGWWHWLGLPGALPYTWAKHRPTKTDAAFRKQAGRK